MATTPTASTWCPQVRAVASGLGSADALRAVADSLVADAVAVLSADLVSDVTLGAVLAAHTVRTVF